MNSLASIEHIHAAALWQAADRAARAIPPGWPLSATVAVNPFVGQTNKSFAETAELIGRLAGIKLSPERSWFADRISKKLIANDDLSEASLSLSAKNPMSINDLRLAAFRDSQPADSIPTIAELAARASGIDWPRLVIDRITAFTSGYFDDGQALWGVPKGKGAYSAWRLFAIHDLTPEIAGLSGFAEDVSQLPLSTRDTIAVAGAKLGIGDEPGFYFHQLLLGLGGFGQYARYLQFVAERVGGEDTTILDLLAIRMAFDVSLLRLYSHQIGPEWKKTSSALRQPITPTPDREIDAALLSAAERTEDRGLITALEWGGLCGKVTHSLSAERPTFQAAFCIDVRSEIFRRALETADTGAVTLGFAGFFGMGVSYRSVASDVSEHRMPVLLPSRQFACDAVSIDDDRTTRYRARAVRAFGRFRQAAVSSFAFIEAMGPVYAAKLLASSFSRAAPKMPRVPPIFNERLGLETRLSMAESILRAMSLTENFSRVVLLAGHGAASVNNPFLSALHCGACGGHAGDVNARLLATLLNDTEVRSGLAATGIRIPVDTIFIAGLHNTTTDEVTLFEDDIDATAHATDIKRLKDCLQVAGRLARSERRKRLPGTQNLSKRSGDWAQIRPEWALAGCRAFVAAPRTLTVGHSLQGQVFLHDYVWQKDKGFGILELILTAPVVVASWINLQYFGSTVAPDMFGAGNKLLHNVVSGIGVLEGNSGPLRTGLPWQSMHDGERLMHDPLRLAVIVSAPASAITDILSCHPDVRALFDNGWMRLYALAENGGPTLRYRGDLTWCEQESQVSGDLNRGVGL